MALVFETFRTGVRCFKYQRTLDMTVRIQWDCYPFCLLLFIGY